MLKDLIGFFCDAHHFDPCLVLGSSAKNFRSSTAYLLFRFKTCFVRSQFLVNRLSRRALSFLKQSILYINVEKRQNFI